ncbi:hypothetical protein [Pedobacter sp.]|uniref:hypothetical protein n=1 Tax=Pedobacter sp. TaxID=1411316 RepID=UPI00396C4CAC
MKNFKFLAVAIVVLVAGSAFAYFNGEPKPVKKVLATQTYYHIGGNYVPMSNPPSGLECTLDDYFCTVRIDGEQSKLPVSFSEDAIPTSDANLTVTPGNDAGSWQ